MNGQNEHRILLTGAQGFLGQQICREIESDSSCRGLFLSRSSQPAFDVAQIAKRGNLSALEKILLDFQPTALIHLAWGKVRRHEREDVFHVNENFGASKILFDFMAKHFPECLLIGVGSQAELGAQNSAHTAASLGSPANLYGQGKAKARDYLLRSYPERSVWIRLLTLYGAGDHQEKFIPYLISNLKSQRPIEMTRGEQLWDFLHVQDAAAAFVAAAKTKDLRGIHVLASEEAWPLEKIARFLQNKAQEDGLKTDLKIGARPYSPTELMLLAGESLKFRAQTGWGPQRSLEHALSELWKQG